MSASTATANQEGAECCGVLPAAMSAACAWTSRGSQAAPEVCSVGWAKDTGKDSVFAPSDEQCCLMQCQAFQCPDGWTSDPVPWRQVMLSLYIIIYTHIHKILKTSQDF